MSETISFKELNESSRGKNYAMSQQNHSNLGRRSIDGSCGYFNHPDGHNDDVEAHHDFAHIHAWNKKGEKIIITYGSRIK